MEQIFKLSCQPPWFVAHETEKETPPPPRFVAHETGKKSEASISFREDTNRGGDLLPPRFVAHERNKALIIDYLGKLVREELLTIYAFVLMPNHIHIIWQQNKLNRKETAQGSLLKYTAHEFLKDLKLNNQLYLYEVNAANKKHELWQRDSLSIEIYSRKVAVQKLQYIHFNPVSKKWALAKDDISYYWSSATFYETGVDNFGFLSNLYTVFDGE